MEEEGKTTLPSRVILVLKLATEEITVRRYWTGSCRRLTAVSCVPRRFIRFSTLRYCYLLYCLQPFILMTVCQRFSGQKKAKYEFDLMIWHTVSSDEGVCSWQHWSDPCHLEIWDDYPEREIHWNFSNCWNPNSTGAPHKYGDENNA